MNLEFDKDVTINGKDYWVRSQIHVDVSESSGFEECWGSVISVSELSAGLVDIESLVVLDYSEEDQEYNIQIIDKEIIKEATRIVKDWATDQEVELE